jgi:2'-hydroxyisoflavone reductase
VNRINRGGDIIIPGSADNTHGLVDVRDLAKFTVRLVEKDQPGIFNSSGPAGYMSYAGMLESIRATTTSPVRFHRVDDTFLEELGVDGRELPMWNRSRPTSGMLFENQSSIDAGHGFHKLAATARDTHAWHTSLPAEEQAFTRAGLDPDKEASVLAAWRKHTG